MIIYTQGQHSKGVTNFSR